MVISAPQWTPPLHSGVVMTFQDFDSTIHASNNNFFDLFTCQINKKIQHMMVLQACNQEHYSSIYTNQGFYYRLQWVLLHEDGVYHLIKHLKSRLT